MAAASGASPSAKLVILGATNAGKSCLLERFTKGTFGITTSGPTIGAAFGSHLLHGDGPRPDMRLEIWDTAGMEKFQSLTPMYYRGAHGALVVFDVTSSRSYAGMKGWVEALETNGPDGVAIVLCGNKSDIVDMDETAREVDYEEAAEYGKHIGAAYFETSAKTGDNVVEAFTHVVNELWERRRAQAGESDIDDAGPGAGRIDVGGDGGGVSRDATGTPRRGGSGCCS